MLPTYLRQKLVVLGFAAGFLVWGGGVTAPAQATLALSCADRFSQPKFPPIDLERKVVDSFVQSIPFDGGYKNPYKDTTIRERNQIVKAFKAARNGNLVRACQALRRTNYQLQTHTDKSTGRKLVLLRERLVKGSYPRAWGLYIIAWPVTGPSGNTSKLTVEVPHACPDMQPSPACKDGDSKTHFVGVKVFQHANAHYLFLNGADRVAGCPNIPNTERCSDMAHQSGSLFEKIHEAAVLGPQGGFGPSAKVYESHRFNKNCHDGDKNTSCSSEDKGETTDNVNSLPLPGNGCGGVANVVVSNGTANPSTLATNLAKALEEKDGLFFRVCLFPGPKDCSDLGATTNVQGQYMGGGSFVHVEANQDVVGDPTRREQLAMTIADTMQ